MNPKFLTGLALAALLAAGCSAGQTRLEGAVLAGKVPVVKSATFDGQMGGTSYGDESGETSKSMSWFFDTDAPLDDVVAFYRAELPDWAVQEDSDGGQKTVTFTGKPEGANEGEYLQVIVSPGRVQIHESYAAKRVKGDS